MGRSPRIKPRHQPTCLSFFSGAMGMDQGLEKAGFEVLLACDSDRYCRETIALNRPSLPVLEDLNLYSADEILGLVSKKPEKIDLVVGGPPCQAFSTAGKRNGFKDDRGNVFLKFLEVAFHIRPRFLVIENVRGLLSCPMTHRPHQFRGPEFDELSRDEMPGGALSFVLSLLKRNGYGYCFDLYNSANFGTPQIRERVVLICSRDGRKPPYLVPTHSETGLHGLAPWKTFREATGDLREHHHIEFPEKRLRYYRLLKEGQNWRSLPVELQKEALGNSFLAGGGKTGFLRRLAWDKPSPTLVTHPAMPATDLAHPVEDRPLSIEEYRRVQEFPENWKLAGPLLEQYRQVGNAVPVGLGTAVGSLVSQLLKNDAVIQYEGFQYSRYRNTRDREWESQFNSEQKHPRTHSNRQQMVLFE